MQRGPGSKDRAPAQGLYHWAGNRTGDLPVWMSVVSSTWPWQLLLGILYMYPIHKFNYADNIRIIWS